MKVKMLVLILCFDREDDDLQYTNENKLYK